MYDFKKEYFLLLAKNYFDWFLDSLIELVELSFKQKSDENEIIYLYGVVSIIKDAEKFNKESMSKLTDFFQSLNKKLLVSIKQDYKLEVILEIIVLDKKSYNFIEQLKEIDSSRAEIYSKYLMKIEPRKILNKLFGSYQNQKLEADVQKSENKYDKPNINPRKIDLFKIIITLLEQTNNSISLLSDNQIELF